MRSLIDARHACISEATVSAALTRTLAARGILFARRRHEMPAGDEDCAGRAAEEHCVASPRRCARHALVRQRRNRAGALAGRTVFRTAIMQANPAVSEIKPVR
ncbi:hypothetical protein BSIN_3378 [Burkholderia singularis]|uniref:Uncharacterized protein n=1 Tax=Burkholderia singularis TaxID=1503053 RepID=A0A238H4Z2_9BURK|nr:hypothetical protein BSIN_3378 [Burkholderia singularis]